MSKGTFIDKTHKPTKDEVNEEIGALLPVWQRLLEFLDGEFGVCGEYKFYGKNYGWAFRYTKKGKSLAALYPGKNAFTVQVILTDDQAGVCMAAGIGENLRNIINSTHRIHEGKWIFVPVTDARGLEDVMKLVRIRALGK